MVPVPKEARLILPEWALIQAISSGTELTGTAGFTSSTSDERVLYVLMPIPRPNVVIQFGSNIIFIRLSLPGTDQHQLACLQARICQPPGGSNLACTACNNICLVAEHAPHYPDLGDALPFQQCLV